MNDDANLSYLKWNAATNIAELILTKEIEIVQLININESLKIEYLLVKKNGIVKEGMHHIA